MARQMREKVLSARIRVARKQVSEGRQDRGSWADTYAKDVTELKKLLIRFVIADAARGIAMNNYPGPTRAEKAIFETRVRAQSWLGANIVWNGPR